MNETGKLSPFVLGLPPGTPACLMGLALATISLYTFGELAGDVRTGAGFTFDQSVMETLHRLASPWLTVTMRLITTSGSGLVAAGIAMGLGVRWWRQAERRAEVIVLLVTMASGAVLGRVLKLIFARPRPQLFPWLTAAGGWSFPSGHTLTAVVLGGLVAWLIGQHLAGKQRAILWVAAGLWAGLVGLSRIYLGVHYPSDVLASWAVGTLCLLLASCVYGTTVSCPVGEG